MSMQTSREEIHSHRSWRYTSFQSTQPTEQVILESADKVNALTQQQYKGNNLEAELYACYAAQNTEDSQKKLLKFLRNSNKIRWVLESVLREVLNWFSWAASKWNKSVVEIHRLINEELERRSRQGNIFTQR